MSEGYVLSIDQGTTGSTVLIFDHDGQIKSRAYSEFTQHYPKPGWVEHDAEEIWLVTVKVIAEALHNANIRASDLNAIGITNQRETAVLWDRATGKPVANAIVWQDRRTARYCDELKERGLEEMIRHKTGLVIDPYFSGTKVKWLLDNVTGLRARAERGEIAFGTIDSWLVWQLTGGKTHITDYSNASRTLLYNIQELCWDDEILELLNIPKAILPEAKPSSCVYGKTDPEIFFGTHSIPVAGIAGDQQAALFGPGLSQPRTGQEYVWHWLFRVDEHRQSGRVQPAETADHHRLGHRRRAGAVRAGRSHFHHRRRGAMAARWPEDHQIRVWRPRSWRDQYRVMKASILSPALVGLGAPHWDPYARGLLIGITRGTTQGHIARAVLESMTYQTRDVIEAMQRDSGITLKELRCDGGASVNSVLMQFQSDILGRPG